MKKVLSITLAVVALVASLGFISVASAPVASAQEASAEEADFRGAGTLQAQGDGIALLGGRGVVDLSGNGILWIRDLAGDATIEVTGHGKKEEFNDGWIQYANFHGTAHVKGTKIIVCIAGADIDLFAKGRGRAMLWGHGTYQINGETSEWSRGFGKHISLDAPDAS
jgi:hypothetical protein